TDFFPSLRGAKGFCCSVRDAEVQLLFPRHSSGRGAQRDRPSRRVVASIRHSQRRRIAPPVPQAVRWKRIPKIGLEAKGGHKLGITGKFSLFCLVEWSITGDRQSKRLTERPAASGIGVHAGSSKCLSPKHVPPNSLAVLRASGGRAPWCWLRWWRS